MNEEEVTDLLLHISEVCDMLADFSALLEWAFSEEEPLLSAHLTNESSIEEPLQNGEL